MIKIKSYEGHEAFIEDIKKHGPYVKNIDDSHFYIISEFDDQYVVIDGTRYLFDDLSIDFCWPNGDPCGTVEDAAEYEKDYDPALRVTRETAGEYRQPVSILVSDKGEVEGVLVRALGEAFVIDPFNFNNGKEMKWAEAMEALAKEGKFTFSKEQAYLMLYLKDKINEALKAIGGDLLEDFMWTATEYYSVSAWFVGFGSGGFGNNTKCNSYVVRAVAAFS